METWNNDNLPENHKLMQNVQFTNVTKGTWNRKKQDGTNETATKWNYITKADEHGFSEEISVYSATDQEQIELNKAYDVIVKAAIGKDGTMYGYSLKGFGEAGKPIAKKVPSSRFEKSIRQNNRAVAVQAAATIYTGSSEVDAVITAAEAILTWLDDK